MVIISNGYILSSTLGHFQNNNLVLVKIKTVSKSSQNMRKHGKLPKIAIFA